MYLLLVLCAAWLDAGCRRAVSLDATAPPATTTPALLSFADATQAAGLGAFRHLTGADGAYWMPESLGGGGAFVDYDGDGWQDVVLVRGGTLPASTAADGPALELYRNDGDGTFTRQTEHAGLDALRAYGFGVAAADYDRDGDTDLFVATLTDDLLLRNDGGRFTEVARAAGVAGDAGWSTSATFFDADRDGWPDLYVARYVDWSPEKDIWCTVDGQTKDYCSPRDYAGLPGRYYRNNGDGTFTDRTDAAGFGASPGKSLAVTELDYDGDGWTDLVVANDTQRDLLFRNRGDGTFEEVGVRSGIAFDENGKARAGMGLAVGDVDGSGQATVFVANFSNEMVGVYRHVGNGVFVDRAAASGVGQPTLLSLTFGLSLADLDLDGDEDLLLANGHIWSSIEQIQDAIKYRQPAQLFLNDGAGRFTEAPATGVFTKRLLGRATAYGDYDRDGDLDLLLVENGGPAHLWRNELDPRDAGGPHYLRVHLAGRESNPDAFGARIVAVAGDRRQERRVRGGGSYLSQSEGTATFGLGGTARVDSLYVFWPSGRQTILTDLPANQELRLVEGDEAERPL